ncbi:MAG TPA: hypothetical protein VI197_02825 [Polyangiaceae bacterium]
MPLSCTLRALGAAATAASVACSLIVPADPQVIHCRERGAVGAPACPANFVCADGICDACAEHEACSDAVDNDCDGVVDDGCLAGAGGEAGAPPSR